MRTGMAATRFSSVQKPSARMARTLARRSGRCRRATSGGIATAPGSRRPRRCPAVASSRESSPPSAGGWGRRRSPRSPAPRSAPGRPARPHRACPHARAAVPRIGAGRQGPDQRIDRVGLTAGQGPRGRRCEPRAPGRRAGPAGPASPPWPRARSPRSPPRHPDAGPGPDRSRTRARRGPPAQMDWRAAKAEWSVRPCARSITTRSGIAGRAFGPIVVSARTAALALPDPVPSAAIRRGPPASPRLAGAEGRWPWRGPSGRHPGSPSSAAGWLVTPRPPAPSLQDGEPGRRIHGVPPGSERGDPGPESDGRGLSRGDGDWPGPGGASQVSSIVATIAGDGPEAPAHDRPPCCGVCGFSGPHGL